MKKADQNLLFNVQITMQNCGSLIILDPKGNRVSKVESYVANTATHYSSRDSVYRKQSNQLVRMKAVNSSRLMSMHAISFPSVAQQGGTRADGDGQWAIDAYVTMEDGTVTKNRLTIDNSLDAAQLYVIKGTIDANGSLTTTNAEVGVSVTLNWQEGGVYNPEI